MIFDQYDGRVQVVRTDQRVPADADGAAVTHALSRDGFGGSERGAWVGHVVTHAGNPGPERGHHLLAGFG
jgi:hypothetical protein